jgi:hypothetical protein
LLWRASEDEVAYVSLGILRRSVNMTPVDRWLQDLAYLDFPDELLRAGQSAGTRQYAAEIEELLAPDRGIGAAAVFCVGEQPTVCFIDASTLVAPREWRVEQIRQRVWNQNLASVVLVLDRETLTAYSLNDRDAEPDTLTHSEINRSGNWSAYEVQSGFIKDRLSSWFTPDERVDQRLLTNLREVVKRLAKEKDGLSDSEAEALMAQVIFLCYLEQRGVIGEAYRRMHKLDHLEAYVRRQDGVGVDRLLKRLSMDFNGDFLSSRDGGAPSWSSLSSPAFWAIQQFLEAVDVETGQGSFWRYDFSHIPVELISGIYETLLKDRQGALGAYYTPRHLANLAAAQALQSVADPAECTIYDGACGSGILLTTAFRRVLRHAEIKRGCNLRFSERVALMQRTVFGNDIDETACWITAFSLYLSLLEGLAPADISLLQTDEQIKLPKLIGANLNIQKGTERGDFFSPKNPFAGSAKFDVFLCNPPWRESDNEEKPTWEEWCRDQVPAYPIGRRQIAAGFAYRAMHSVKQGGVIVLIRNARKLPQELYKSLTWDRGKEMAGHKRFTLATDIQVYFCDPRSPWQRGSNENTNGLLRQYLPKGIDISTYSQAKLNALARQLNERPRKTLGFQTPAEMFSQTVASTG